MRFGFTLTSLQPRKGGGGDVAGACPDPDGVAAGSVGVCRIMVEHLGLDILP